MRADQPDSQEEWLAVLSTTLQQFNGFAGCLVIGLFNSVSIAAHHIEGATVAKL